jgi:hypothetical protein
MSRIILSRHDNGEEHVIVGFDRPLQHFFWSEYDRMGESTDESYLDHGLTPRTPDEFARSTGGNLTVDEAVARKIETHNLMTVLERHMGLEYPDSNVTVDYTREKEA